MQRFGRSYPVLLSATTSSPLRSSTCLARYTSHGLARSASTTSESNNDPFKKPLRHVQRLYKSPDSLKGPAKEYLEYSDAATLPRYTFKFIAALETAPYVDGRWDLINALRQLAPEEYSRTLVAPKGASAPKSHAEGLEAINKVKEQADEPLETTRSRAYGIVLRWRFPDASFAPLSAVLDSTATLSDEEKGRTLRRYIGVLPENAYHVRTNWEREALAARGSSSDAAFASALDAVRAAEEHISSKLPKEFANVHTRSTLLRAYSALRAPAADSMRHWSYLVENKLALPWMFDAALRSARDGAAIQKISSQSVAGLEEASRSVLVARHYSRLGLFDDASRAVTPEKLQSVWTYWALRNDKPKAYQTNHLINAYNALSDSGFDINEIEWLLVDYPAFSNRRKSKPSV